MMCRTRRHGSRRDEVKLTKLLRSLPIATAEKVIRAFSTYFQLVNIAEESHRIRRKRFHEAQPGFIPQRGSVEDVVQRLFAARIPGPWFAV